MKKLLLFLVILCCVSTFALDLEELDRNNMPWRINTKKINYNNMYCGLIETTMQRERGEETLYNARYNENYVTPLCNEDGTSKYLNDTNEWQQTRPDCFAWATAGCYTILEEETMNNIVKLRTQLYTKELEQHHKEIKGSVKQCFTYLTSNEIQNYHLDNYNHLDSSIPSDIEKKIDDGIPVVLQMKVYKDFKDYGTGVYQHVYGNFIGYHSVVIVGYYKNRTGSDNNYYDAFLVKNSWGKDWGDNGYCWIAYNQLENLILNVTVNDELMPAYYGKN